MSTPIPAPSPRDLTIAEQDTSALQSVLQAWVKLTVHRLLHIPPAVVAPENRQHLDRLVRGVRGRLRSDARALVAVLREPTISTLIHCIAGHQGPGGDHRALNAWLRELSYLLHFEWAVRGQLGKPVAMPVRHGLTQERSDGAPVLRSIDANLAVHLRHGPDEDQPDGRRVTGLRFEDGTLHLHGRAAGAQRDGVWTLDLRDVDGTIAAMADADEQGLPFRLTRPYHVITHGIVLALEDNNPLSDFEAHPDKEGNQLDLGDIPVDAWLASLRGSFERIERHMPLLADELRTIARVVVPVGWDAEKHLSASYQEAIGVVYMTLHPNDMTMVEAVIHEFQHNKINALFQLDPLLQNAFEPLYTSPVRPDPRPLHGVILAIHAFQPVARLYQLILEAEPELARHPSFVRRFRQILEKNRDGSKTVLDHGVPTEVGAVYLDEVRRIDEAFAAYEAERFKTNAAA